VDKVTLALTSRIDGVLVSAVATPDAQNIKVRFPRPRKPRRLWVIPSILDGIFDTVALNCKRLHGFYGRLWVIGADSGR